MKRLPKDISNIPGTTKPKPGFGEPSGGTPPPFNPNMAIPLTPSGEITMIPGAGGGLGEIDINIEEETQTEPPEIQEQTEIQEEVQDETQQETQ